MDFSVPMALVDFIPVILFLVTAVLLQRSFYGLLVKGACSLLAAGTICITAAGIFKALWKLLYALGVCDFVKLNQVFFPMQTLGFVLAGIALLWYAFSGGNGKAVAERATGALAAVAIAAQPQEYSGTMIFVALMVLGLLGICLGLFLVAKRMHQPLSMVLFVLAFIFMLAMGYLSSRDSSSAVMNWIDELVNTAGQLCLLFGVVRLNKAGLGKAA